MKLAEAIARTGQDVLDYLDRAADVPVVTRAAAQGDVSILATDISATTPLPPAGVVVVRGENGGHTHSLHGDVFFDASPDAGLALGTLTVPVGKEALMSHPEHGALLIAPGSYRIGRQREWAGEWRMVAD